MKFRNIGRTAKGLPIINILQIDKDETINTVIAVQDYEMDEDYLFFTTKQGLVKRVSLSEFKNIRKSGLIAIRLRENDELISVRLTDGKKDIGIATKHGYFIRFDENNVRPMGRNASGVRGISLREGDEVVSMDVIEEGAYILHVTEKESVNGRKLKNTGKRTVAEKDISHAN